MENVMASKRFVKSVAAYSISFYEIQDILREQLDDDSIVIFLGDNLKPYAVSKDGAHISWDAIQEYLGKEILKLIPLHDYDSYEIILPDYNGPCSNVPGAGFGTEEIRIVFDDF